MAIEYVTAFKGVQFYCTTSERAFGPVLPDMDTGERFIAFLGSDPRLFSAAELEILFLEFSCPDSTSLFSGAHGLRGCVYDLATALVGLLFLLALLALAGMF